MPAVITIDPLPPTQGQDARVSYTGDLPATLNIEWTPSGAGPAAIRIDANGEASLLIPANAESLKIGDPSGTADAAATIIKPA